jgi:hypothetical protein
MAISTGGAEGGGSPGVGANSTRFAMGGTGPRQQPTKDGGMRVASSFGVANTTTFDDFKARSFINSERVRQLARRESYFRCTHHDFKMYDFDGRVIAPGPPTSQPMLSAESASYYVPLKLRRPSAPYRLARVIVNSFTALLFGHGRWPKIRVHGDHRSEDFARELAKQSKLRTLMIRARNIGGSVGTVGLSWCYYEGLPKVGVHNGKHLYVHEWADRAMLIPKHVSEVYTYPVDEYDAGKRAFIQKWYWYRRDWTEDADIEFDPVEFKADEDPRWSVKSSVEHGDGECHLIWIQNLPEDDGTAIDGQSDYAESYESFDSLDLLKSVVVRGATLNLDPTLVLKMDPDLVSRTGLKKGSDNSLMVGTDGGASYMELQGTSINVGISLIDKMRDAVLEATQCVIPDPDMIAGSGTSSLALKVRYEPMLAKCEILREQYGDGIERLLSQMLRVAQARTTTTHTEVDEETGEEKEIKLDIKLPPRVKTDTDSKGETTHESIEREPGESTDIDLDWPAFFNPTPTDQQAAATTIGTAVTQQILSRKTGIEELASIFNLDPNKEQYRIGQEMQERSVNQAAMFAGDMGGKVDSETELPAGAEGAPPPAPEPTDADAAPSDDADAKPAGLGEQVEQQGKLQLTASDLASITTVNEARASVGLSVLLTTRGQPDPDGELTVAEFAAQRAAKGEAKGEITGKVAGEKATGEKPEPPKPPAPPKPSPFGG